jgi:plastocyanin
MTARQRVTTIVVLGLLGVFVAATEASAGGGGHCEPSEDRGTRVDLANACFTPTALFAEPGQTITFVNRDPFAHNVSGAGWGRYDDMAQGTRFTASFDEAGVYAYACTLHPGMTGSIVVGDRGSAGASTDDVQPVASSTVPTSDGDGRVAAGLIGLVIGAAAGAGVAKVRRRAAAV